MKTILQFLNIISKSTTSLDKLVLVVTLFYILIYIFLQTSTTQGNYTEIYLDNKLLKTLQLTYNQKTEILGHLGVVVVEIDSMRARIVEYKSPKMIGTRTNWISGSGAIAACIPCGVMVKIVNDSFSYSNNSEYDGIAQ
ncbi:NusG domain II-containing protein [Candidatus Magnetaquicoccus inordinatus]|uniref:NusG domain II-containing protein n=1 Tax=Candidatus Magnetaquicoccus inordinatus TaxID=2496818 RepID=UPI00102B805A|nr:NusG domain II-containing protein [Candidatus Magnetaquicoccus inordinatus]